MEGEYNAILDWISSTGSVLPGATTQWGSSIVIAGEAKRIEMEELHGRYVRLHQGWGAAGHQGIPTLPWEL